MDFTNPTRRNVSQVVVTGPGAPENLEDDDKLEMVNAGTAMKSLESTSTKPAQ